MLVNFKTVSGQSFQLDCGLDLTLAEIKLQISDEKGSENFPVELQKLIYKGRVRGDEEKLSDLKLEKGGEKKHIIIMCRPPTAKPSAVVIKGLANTVPTSASDELLKVSGNNVKPAPSIKEIPVPQIQVVEHTCKIDDGSLKVSNKIMAEVAEECGQQPFGKEKSPKEVSKTKVSFASPLPVTMAVRKQERLKRFGLDIKPTVELGQLKSVEEPSKVIKDAISKIGIAEKTLRSDAISPPDDVLLKRSERFNTVKVEADDVYAEKKKARLKRFGLITPETEVLEKRAKRFASSDGVDCKVIEERVQEN